MTDRSSISVLLPVYIGDDLSIFKDCIASLLDELIIGDQLIIVQDGPVSSEMNVFLDSISFSDVKLLKLPKNVGLSVALNYGLEFAKHDYIARVDADDICVTGRFLQQWRAMKKYDVDICSGFVLETGDYIGQNVVKRVPESNADIKRFMIFRNPINHMAVMYRRSAIWKAGKYPNIHGAEDYGLWLACLGSGSSFHNIQSELMIASTPKDFLSRRIDRAYLQSEWKIHLMKRRAKIASPLLLNFVLLLRLLHRITPRTLSRWVYKGLRTGKL